VFLCSQVPSSQAIKLLMQKLRCRRGNNDVSFALELQTKEKRKKAEKQYMIAKKISCTDRGFSSGFFGQMKQVTLLMLIQDGAKYQAFHFKMPSVMVG
jgi:hypothetical protein